MSDLFKSAPEPEATPDQGDADASPLDALVGEGKKFKDHDELAKGKIEADKHIANLEKELGGIREDLNSRLNMQQFLDRLEQSGTKPNDGQQASQGESAEDRDIKTDGLSMKDVEAIISQKLTETTAQSQRQANINSTVSKLEENLGPSYGDKVLGVTKDLGVSKEFMEDLAATNPTAFLKLVGADKAPAAPQSPKTFTTPRSSITTPSGNTGDKTNSYYKKMLSDDPKRYWSKEVQSEMHRVAMQKGESFFD